MQKENWLPNGEVGEVGGVLSALSNTRILARRGGRDPRNFKFSPSNFTCLRVSRVYWKISIRE